MKHMFTMLVCFAVSATVAYAQNANAFVKADSLFFLSQWQAAIPQYESALKNVSQNAVAWNRLAFSYHNLGRYDKAVDNYQKALENKPSPILEAAVHARLARIAAVQKRTDEAFNKLEKALASGYVNLTEIQTSKDFDNIRSDKRFADLEKRVETNAFPCMTIPQAREFDFWVGEWDVYPNGASMLIGHSKVEVASGGCMILENWTALGPVPNTGKSINYVNTTTGKWEQHWVGSGGLNAGNPQMFVNGVYKDGAMRFEFESTSAQNQKQMGRFIFYNLGPDQVRQFNEVSADGGQTWTTVYDFIYKRKK